MPQCHDWMEIQAGAACWLFSAWCGLGPGYPCWGCLCTQTIPPSSLSTPRAHISLPAPHRPNKHCVNLSSQVHTILYLAPATPTLSRSLDTDVS